jgi:hypothetical protein
MQMQENYFNQTILPSAIVGEGDVNFKEIQEELIYGPNDLKSGRDLSLTQTVLSHLKQTMSPTAAADDLQIGAGNLEGTEAL